jgi:CDP-diacylglycerol--glycerol-3-phosphate 3-phosphatidyltransferase
MLDRRWRAGVERRLDPVGRTLTRIGVSADVLTLIGLLVAIGTGFLIATGELTLAFFGVICSGLPDMLDGTVARHSGKAGPRGAFLDSVCDRVSDGALFVGTAWYVTDEDPHLAVLAAAVLGLSMLVTYERARAESLGFNARGGLMERAERLVLLAVGLLFDVVVPVLWVMLALTAFTAVQRFVMVWRQATASARSEGVKVERPARPTRARRFLRDGAHPQRRESSELGPRPRRLPRVSGRR